MSWITLAVVSALFLGIYDLLKKVSVRENAVLPVLFYSVVTGAAVWLPLLLWSVASPGSAPSFAAPVTSVPIGQHLLLFTKSVVAAAAWTTGYFALKHLPISIAGPIRSTSPLWTILVAVMFLHESPSVHQWIGVATILISFYAFSLVGKREGIHFHRNQWVGLMFASALLSSASALFDKYLLQSTDLTPAVVQCWFSIYLVVALLPLYLMWRKGLWTHNHFEWRWSIPLIGIALLAADYLYFSAVNADDALISIISPVRRSSVIVTFVGGITLFGERHWRLKLACIAGILIGIVLLQRS